MFSLSIRIVPITIDLPPSLSRHYYYSLLLFTDVSIFLVFLASIIAALSVHCRYDVGFDSIIVLLARMFFNGSRARGDRLVIRSSAYQHQ